MADLWHGSAAAVVGPGLAATAGGVAVIVGMVAVVARFREFWRYRAPVTYSPRSGTNGAARTSVRSLNPGPSECEGPSTMTADDTAVLHLPGGDQEMPIKSGHRGIARRSTSASCSPAPATPRSTPATATPRACSSAITYIDGDAGILRYRGYPIDQLAEHSTFLEVSYLLIYGELPTAGPSSTTFTNKISRHTLLHEDLKAFFNGFPRDAHPMPVLSSAVSALSTFYQDSLDPFNADDVELSTIRLLAKLPTIAAYAYKKSIGQPFLYPDNSLGLVENFLRMTFGFPAEPYEVDPEIARALDILLILHADHEQNCSTSTVRLVGSSQANLFASISAGINALFGPLHGGANQAVLEMLQKIQRRGEAATSRTSSSGSRTRRTRARG